MADRTRPPDLARAPRPLAHEIPRELTLPSGVRIEVDGACLQAAARVARAGAPIARAFEVLGTPGALRRRDGNPLVWSELSLRDAHALRAVVTRCGLFDEAARELPCMNCGEVLRVVASSAFEPGPLLDGELDDPDLDAPFAFSERHAIPAIFTPDGIARGIRLAPRTVADVALLAQARAPLSLSRAVVVALGVVALGRSRKAGDIARALGRADDRAWTAIATLWEAAHYSRRLTAHVRCSCGARNELPVPSDRELDAVAPPFLPDEPGRAPPGFPSEETFASWVRAAKRRVFAEARVRNVPVIVDYDVPACDDGGEPLLGCYTPPSGPDATLPSAQAPEVRIFYRSFLEQARVDSSFDVRAEIEETVEHEIEHHLHFLRGDDPMDDEERAVIAAEHVRIVGRSELTRRALGALGSELVGFFRVALPLIVLLLALTAWRYCRPA